MSSRATLQSRSSDRVRWNRATCRRNRARTIGTGRGLNRFPPNSFIWVRTGYETVMERTFHEEAAVDQYGRAIGGDRGRGGPGEGGRGTIPRGAEGGRAPPAKAPTKGGGAEAKTRRKRGSPPAAGRREA